MKGQGGFKEVGLICCFLLIPFVFLLSVMSLSDQHPYSKYVASRFCSPELQKAYIEVGDNANAYLVSTDIVSF